jgi:hypothetical protein
MPPTVTSPETEYPDAEVLASATGQARFSQWQRGVQAAGRTATPTPQDCCGPSNYA